MLRPRGRMALLGIGVAAALISTAGGATASAEPSGTGAGGVDFVARELIVRYTPGTTAAERAAARGLVEARLERTLPIQRAELLELPAGASVAAAAATLKGLSIVLYAEPNFIYRPAEVVPDDPIFGQLWGLRNTGDQFGGSADADVDATDAWERTTGSASTVVAVVDTGIALDHPDLSGNLWANPGESGNGRESNGLDDDGNGFIDDLRGWDWAGDDFQLSPPDDHDPADGDGHGTHVAGTIGAEADNGIGVSGVNWDLSLMALRVCRLNLCTGADLASAFAYAASNGADVVNASISGKSSSATVAAAITAAPETLFVVAAGNDGSNNDSAARYPCNYAQPNLVCVAASTTSDELAGFSNYGASSVDLAAPGVFVVSAYPFAIPNPLSEGFSSGLDDWSTGGEPNSWAPTSVKKEGTSGKSVTDSPNGDYVPNADNYLLSPAIDLHRHSGCRLRYWLSLDVPDQGDALKVEASTDGGTFSPIREWHTTESLPFTRIVAHDLSAYDGATKLRIRFRLVSDGDGATGDGAYVDGVQVRCAESTYGYLSGTSMATAHVTGAAALVASEHRDANVAELRRWLLDGVDPASGLDGKVASGGRLNAARSLDLAAAAPDRYAGPKPPALVSTAAWSSLAPAFCQGLKRRLHRARPALKRRIQTLRVRYRRHCRV